MDFAFDRLINEYSGHFAQTEIEFDDWKHTFDLNVLPEASRMFGESEFNIFENNLRQKSSLIEKEL